MDLLGVIGGIIGDAIEAITFWITGIIVVVIIGAIVGGIIGAIVGAIVGGIRGKIADGIAGGIFVEGVDGSEGGCLGGFKGAIIGTIVAGIATLTGLENINASAIITVSGIIGGIYGAIYGAIIAIRKAEVEYNRALARACWLIETLLRGIIGSSAIGAIIGTIVAGIATVIGVENVNASAIVTVSAIIGGGIIVALFGAIAATGDFINQAGAEAMLKAEVMFGARRKAEAKAKTKDKRAMSPPYMFNVPIYNYEYLPKLEAPEGYVYVIQDVGRTWLYKIGRTTNPQILNMSIEQSNITIEMIAIIKTNDAPALEKKLQQRYAAQRTRGWFKSTDADIQEIRSI